MIHEESVWGIIDTSRLEKVKQDIEGNPLLQSFNEMTSQRHMNLNEQLRNYAIGESIKNDCDTENVVED